MNARVLGLTALVLTLRASAPAQESRPPTVKIGESGLRQSATAAPMPVFPASSLKNNKSGVAVAAVVVGVDGHMRTVNVLEAPDAATGDAVRTALMQWVTAPIQVVGDKQKFENIAMLTFYFQIKDGRGEVLNPNEMPGGPVWTKPAASTGQSSASAPTVQREAGDAVQISEDQAAAFIAKEHPIVLDVRNRKDFGRHHRDGAVNIPLEELPVRGGIELPRTKTILVDCTEDPKWFANARPMLASAGIVKVVLLMP